VADPRYTLEGKVVDVKKASTIIKLGGIPDHWIIVVLLGRVESHYCAEVVRQWGTTADLLELIIDWKNKGCQERNSRLVTLRLEYQQSPGITMKAVLCWSDSGTRKFLELTRASGLFAVGFGYLYLNRYGSLRVAIARRFVLGSPSHISEIPASSTKPSA